MSAVVLSVCSRENGYAYRSVAFSLNFFTVSKGREVKGQMAAADASAHRPVDEDKATLLLAQTQQCSQYFRDFDFQQLLTLAHELSVLEFVEGEKIFVENEQATFFGVILEGSLAPVPRLHALSPTTQHAPI